jgi:hypothetical protein
LGRGVRQWSAGRRVDVQLMAFGEATAGAGVEVPQEGEERMPGGFPGVGE